MSRGFSSSGIGETEYVVQTYLPPDSLWYYWHSKGKKEVGRAQPYSRVVTDDKQGIYVRGGSILPIKLHPGAESITSALDLGIRLEVYLDTNDEARGLLYVDDGVTFKHELYNHRLAVEFTFEAGILSFKNNIRGSSYDRCLISIESLTVYGADMDGVTYSLEALNGKYMPEPDTIQVS